MTARAAAGPVETAKSPDAVLKILEARAVTLDGGLWARPVGQPRGAVAARPAHAGNGWQPRQPPDRCRGKTGRFREWPFMDSNVYKWLEAAAFEIARAPSDQLRASSETLIEVVAAAQSDDGYVNSYYTVAEPGRRWTDLAHGHELGIGSSGLSWLPL